MGACIVSGNSSPVCPRLVRLLGLLHRAGKPVRFSLGTKKPVSFMRRGSKIRCCMKSGRIGPTILTI